MMKSAVNAWSIRSDADFETAFALAKAAGFDGIELNVDRSGAHALTMEMTDSELAAVAALSEKYDLPIPSLSTSLWGGKTGLGTDEANAFAAKLLETQLRFAKALGATGILTVPGGQSDSLPLADAFANSVNFYRSQADVMEKYGLNVGVENVWNGFFTSPYDMVKFIDEVDNPYVCAYYDLGNTIAFSNTVDWVRILGKRTRHAHIKGFCRNTGLNSGGKWVNITESSVNWKLVREALDEVGYDGYIAAEVSKYNPEQSWEDYLAMVCREINGIIK